MEIKLLSIKINVYIKFSLIDSFVIWRSKKTNVKGCKKRLQNLVIKQQGNKKSDKKKNFNLSMRIIKVSQLHTLLCSFFAISANQSFRPNQHYFCDVPIKLYYFVK